MKIIKYIFILFILFGVFLSANVDKEKASHKLTYGYDIEFPILPNGEPDEEKIKIYKEMINE